jgi:hypothetical protein
MSARIASGRIDAMASSAASPPAVAAANLCGPITAHRTAIAAIAAPALIRVIVVCNSHLSITRHSIPHPCAMDSCWTQREAAATLFVFHLFWIDYA